MSGVALVLGGGSGIGAAAATLLAEQGHIVAVGDLNPGTAKAVADKLSGEGHLSLDCDVASETSVRNAFDLVEGMIGSIRVLVITAGHPGFIDGRIPSIGETSLESWSQVFGVNATGAFLAIREMLARRAAAPVEQARIITISSLAGQSVGRHTAISYASSKAAILAITRVAAGEAEALGMTVNAIAPGMIDTPMLRGVFPNFDDARAEMDGPIGQPSDIAAVIGFLASSDAGFINGACIDANGGWAMR